MMPAPLDLDNATPRRAPKLSLNSVALHVEQNNGNDARPAKSRVNHLRFDSKAGSSSHSPAERGEQSHHSKLNHSKNSSSRTKRKGSGVLSFLTLKEPTTSALEEFAEREKKKAVQRNVNSPSVMSGVSTQKLPDHVPKVNSKWNGLPDAPKMQRKGSVVARDESKSQASKRNSIASFASSSNSDSTRKLYGSLSSKPSVRKSQDKKRTELRVAELSASSRSLALEETPIASVSPSELDLAVPQLLYDRGYSSCAATSPEASPRTPAADLAISDIKDKLSLAALPVAGCGTFYSSDSEDLVVRTAGLDMLCRPASRLRHDSMGTTQKPAISPTTIIRTGTPSVVRNFSHVSKYVRSEPISQDTPGTVPTLPAGSTQRMTASTLTGAQGGSTATQVLPIRPAGRKNEVLPWEAFEPPAPDTKIDNNKPKRLSNGLGRK